MKAAVVGYISFFNIGINIDNQNLEKQIEMTSESYLRTSSKLPPNCRSFLIPETNLHEFTQQWRVRMPNANVTLKS